MSLYTKSSRVLTDAERTVLRWLHDQDGNTRLVVRPSGKPSFDGWVYMAPRCHAATFLALLSSDLIEAIDGYGPPPSVKARADREQPDTMPPGGNVVQIRHNGWRASLARWFFQLSQTISADTCAVEPHGFALVLMGRGKCEVLHWGLSQEERGQAAAALLRHHAPGLSGWARAYRISERGRAMLAIAEVEARIDATERYTDQQPLRIERETMLRALPRRGEQAAADAGRELS